MCLSYLPILSYCCLFAKTTNDCVFSNRLVAILGYNYIIRPYEQPHMMENRKWLHSPCLIYVHTTYR